MSNATMESNQATLPGTASDLAPTNEEGCGAAEPAEFPEGGQQEVTTHESDTDSIYADPSRDEGEPSQENLDEPRPDLDAMDTDGCSDLPSDEQNVMNVDPASDAANKRGAESPSQTIAGTVVATEGHPPDGSDDGSDDSSDDDDGANPHDELPEGRGPARQNGNAGGPTINDVLIAISHLAAVVNDLSETVTAMQERQTEILSKLQRAEERSEASTQTVETDTSVQAGDEAMNEMETEVVEAVQAGHDEAVDDIAVAPQPQTEPRQGEEAAIDVNGDHEMQGDNNRRIVSKEDRQRKRARTKEVLAERQKRRAVVADLDQTRGSADVFSYITTTLKLKYDETVEALELANATKRPAVQAWVDYNGEKLTNIRRKLVTACKENSIEAFMVSLHRHAVDQRGGRRRLGRKLQLHPAIYEYGDIVEGLLTIAKAKEQETMPRARLRRRPKSATI